MLVKNGSERWRLTACGQFIGFNMHISELRYNIRRMWGKFGVTDISASKNGQYLFKFRDIDGLNSVIDQGPGSKQTFIEPKKLTVWVKMSNVPLEAWSLKGISALASSLGKPMVMDIYDWKPTRCAECKVFGHDFSRCIFNKNKNDGLEKEIDKDSMGRNGKENGGNKGKEKMQEKVYKSSEGQYKQNEFKRNFNYSHNRHQEYRKKQANEEKKNNSNVGSSGVKKVWNLQEKEVEEMRKTANKYSVLDSLPEDDDQELRILKDRIVVDQYLNKNLQPTPAQAANWTQDMRKYHKERCAEVVDVGDSGSEDVIKETGGVAQNMEKNEIIGVEGQMLNDE
ncbi:hypothetical protein CTI12_AA365960 [Artemisia annua]|uniref:Uncharacterized protein n=1 Tax=Artemisia annua TaxID=35608 RepID=A0A2U1MKU0_ARTAN|nr:hypothetical protein CTI12_AA365960 [Artemisia annua]